MQNLQCDWLLSMHYNTTMHAVIFLSLVSWETNVTKFSVDFIHKTLYNAGKKQRENEGEKQIENKPKTGKAER